VGNPKRDAGPRSPHGCRPSGGQIEGDERLDNRRGPGVSVGGH
jgi:hypothetical protein